MSEERKHHEKEQRHVRYWWLWTSLILLLLIAGASVLTWQTVRGGKATSAVGSGATTQTSQTSKSSNTNKGGVPQIFWETIQQQVAQGLHLSVEQVKTRLQEGKTMQEIAAAQGISADQLYSIERGAVHQALEKEYSTGIDTFPEKKREMQSWDAMDPREMDSNVTYLFRTF